VRRLVRDRLGWARFHHEGSQSVPLDVRTLFTRRLEHGTVEKLLFTAEAGADVPAYLCLPHQRPSGARLPLMVCLQGHSTGMHNSVGLDQATESIVVPVEGDRDFALGCLERGVAALCIEQRSLGERAETKQQRKFFHNGCHDAAMRALMLGRTLLGERVFDVSRALAYLATRPEIDPTRIGVMGNSGGGTVALYAAAVLPKLAFVMPSCCLCTYRESILSIYHCTDNYVPGLAVDLELADVAALIAPRPLVAVAGTNDEIFPLAGVRRCFDSVKTVYDCLGAGERLRLVVGSEGHRFYASPAWEAASAITGWTAAVSHAAASTTTGA
jgi:dienelactone hydrolase